MGSFLYNSWRELQKCYFWESFITQVWVSFMVIQLSFSYPCSSQCLFNPASLSNSAKFTSSGKSGWTNSLAYVGWIDVCSCLSRKSHKARDFTFSDTSYNPYRKDFKKNFKSKDFWDLGLKEADAGRYFWTTEKTSDALITLSKHNTSCLLPAQN